MDCKELYAQKLMTAAQAAALVKSGDWVDYGWAVNTPVAVDAELAKRLPELEGVNFRGGILMWVPEIFQIDDPAAHMTWNSWHMGGIERKAIAQGFSFYSPIRYSELPRYYRESNDPVDVAVFQVTPMDEHGYLSIKVISGLSSQLFKRAAILIPAAPPPIITILPLALLENAFAFWVLAAVSKPAIAISLKKWRRSIPFFSNAFN